MKCRKIKYLNSERGFTLLEVLLALVILTIILTSFMKIFPQMGKINKQNEGKLVSVNLMREVLHEWKDVDSTRNVKKFLKGDVAPDQIMILDEQEYDKNDDYHIFSGIEATSGLDLQVKIKKVADLDGNNVSHRMQIIFLKDSLKVSETYGYVIYKSEVKEEGD